MHLYGVDEDKVSAASLSTIYKRNSYRQLASGDSHNMHFIGASCIDAKFPNQTTGTADKFAFRDRENC